MNKLLDGYCRLLEWLLVIMLALMVVLVFGNVVMRYAFNSGITVSEEVARWLFVWLTFLGAVVAVREHAHLGSDMLVSRFGPIGKRICLAVSQVLMVYVTWLLLSGSWQQAQINLDVGGPGDRCLHGHLLCRRRGVCRLHRPDAAARLVAHRVRPTQRGRVGAGARVGRPGTNRRIASGPQPDLQATLTPAPETFP